MRTVYLPGSTLGKMKLPLLFVVDTLSAPVAVLRTVTFAFGSSAPEISVTAPESDELSDCETAICGSATRRAAASSADLICKTVSSKGDKGRVQR